MATINAQITLSTDISRYGLSINKTMTMKKAGLRTGLELTNGLAKRVFKTTAQVDLLTAGVGVAVDVQASKSAKVYIKNTSTDNSLFFKIGIGNSSTTTTATASTSQATTYWEIGRLYGQDWMLIPWIATYNVASDITIQPSVATTAAPMSVEYMVFYE